MSGSADNLVKPQNPHFIRFDFCLFISPSDLNLLVSGSADHLVRLWNPYCVAKPTTLLRGHLTGVSAVSIAAADEGMAKVKYCDNEIIIA